jgi:steroid 5-alpha reductase family enzyme
MVISFLLAFGAMAVAFAALMAFAWIVQQRSGNSGWVDTTWSFALGLIGFAGALWPLADGPITERQGLVAGLVAAWSLRLGSHIALRSAAIADDPRYAEFARQWGAAAPRRMFFFLQAQALASLPLVFAICVAAHRPGGALAWRDLCGAAILLGAVAGEGLADAQLKRFRSRPDHHGRVCDVGLWRWSRHPNYFFQWLGWWAYPVIAVAADYPWGFLTLLAPLLMYWILVHVTGIPPLEQQMERSRGEAYRDYQARTSRFFPRPRGVAR